MNAYSIRWGMVLRVICLVGLTLGTAHAGGGPVCADLERVSVDSNGNEGVGGGNTGDSWISADGRFIAFESEADNLVAGDTNNFQDVFVHDRMTGSTERVSVDSLGNEGNEESGDPRISPDGRFVVFESLATNLVMGDTNGFKDVFIHDRMSGVTERVSVDSLGNESDDESGDVFISADGRFITFESFATNLVAGDTNNVEDCFVHDRMTGATERVSLDSAGNEGNDRSLDPTISADGRFVAFESFATNLVAGDTNGTVDCFFHDRMTGETTRISVDSSGNQATGESDDPIMSSDGRFIVFESNAPDLDGDTMGFTNCFVHDRATGETEVVSVDSQGNLGNEQSNDPKISDDGRYVVFESFATNLVPGADVLFYADIFLHNRLTGTTTRVSVACEDMVGDDYGNDDSRDPSMSPSGRFIVFGSDADNLVPNDLNNGPDVFVAFNATCTDGNVNAGVGLVSDALFINGESRNAQVQEGATTWGVMLGAPAGGNGTFVVHANSGTPSVSGEVSLPLNLGTVCFPMFLNQGATPLAVWNNSGRIAKFGASEYFDGSAIPDPLAAPSVFLRLFDGDTANLPVGTIITFQGLLVDPGSISSLGGSVTNAVVLDIF